MAEPRHLSPASASILRAVIAAVRPRGHGFDQPIDDDVLLEIDRTIPFLPAPMRIAFPVGLRLLEWSTLAFTGARLTRLDRRAAAETLDRWLHSRLAPRRMLVLGLRTLVYLAFYQHPSVLAAMEVRWDRRVPETVRLRAETLGQASHGTGG